MPIPLHAARTLLHAGALGASLGIAGAAAQTGQAAQPAPGSGGPAIVRPAVGDRLGTSAAEIAATLEAQGHAVREIEREDGRFEVELGRAGGRGHEIYVDATSGLVTKIERKY